MITNVTLATPPAAPHMSATVWIILILVALFVGRQYIFAPILIHMRKGNALARMAPAAELVGASEAAKKHLEDSAVALEKEGFVAATPGALGSSTNRSALLQIFVHPANGDVATVIAVDAGKKGTHTLLGFTAEFSDGTEWYTGNSTLPAAVPVRPNHFRCRFPTEKTAARLYALHRAVIANARGKSQRPARVDDALLYQTDREKKSRQWMQDCGYYRLDGELLRATWKGACLGAWRHLAPWRTLDEERDEKLRRELLTGLGVSWNG